jgi:hypothetical protein
MSPFAAALATIADQEYLSYHGNNEADSVLSLRIAQYWQDLALPFPGVGVPWSAVFVSWCVKSAGATTNEFQFSARHSMFVNQAIKNSGIPGAVFIGRRVDDYSPGLGDIVQNNRNGNNFDFDFAAANDDYESHSAIVTEVGEDAGGGYAVVVGGNESDSVRHTVLRLDGNGRLIQRPISSFIAIIECLK